MVPLKARVAESIASMLVEKTLVVPYVWVKAMTLLTLVEKDEMPATLMDIESTARMLVMKVVVLL